MIRHRIAAVVPVKNRPALIVKAVRSIQAQTRALDEIVVVDDASTDSTPDVVAGLAAEDPRIKLVKNSASMGGSGARNRGIEATECEWIAFLDSDDQWLPRKTELQMERLLADEMAVAAFTGWKEPVGFARPPTRITMDMLCGRNWAGPTSVAIARRSTLQKVGGFDCSLPSCQDWDLWLRLRTEGDFIVIPEPLMLFNKGHAVRISNNRQGVLQGHRIVFDRALAHARGWRERARISAQHSIRMAEIFLWEFTEPGNALVSGLRSISLSPTHEALRLVRAAARSSLRAALR